MFTFRTSITFAVMAFIAALAALLIFIQFWTFHLAAKEAASARMDAASAETLGCFEETACRLIVRHDSIEAIGKERLPAPKDLG